MQPGIVANFVHAMDDYVAQSVIEDLHPAIVFTTHDCFVTHAPNMHRLIPTYCKHLSSVPLIMVSNLLKHMEITLTLHPRLQHIGNLCGVLIKTYIDLSHRRGLRRSLHCLLKSLPDFQHDLLKKTSKCVKALSALKPKQRTLVNYGLPCDLV